MDDIDDNTFFRDWADPTGAPCPRVRRRPEVRRPHRPLARSRSVPRGGTRAGRPGPRAASSRSTAYDRAVPRGEPRLLPAPQRCSTRALRLGRRAGSDGHALEGPAQPVDRRLLEVPAEELPPPHPAEVEHRVRVDAGHQVVRVHRVGAERAGPTARRRPRARTPSRMPVSARCPVARRNSRNPGVPSESGEKLGENALEEVAAGRTCTTGAAAPCRRSRAGTTPASPDRPGIGAATTSTQSSRIGNASTSSVHTWLTPAVERASAASRSR